MKTSTISTIAGISVLLTPVISQAQTTDIFKFAQQKFAEESKIQESWSEEGRKLDAEGEHELEKRRCLPNENPIVCQVVALCSRAPEIAGESFPDFAPVKAADDAMDKVASDLKKLAIAMDQVDIVTKHWQEETNKTVDRCEAKVRQAYNQLKTQ